MTLTNPIHYLIFICLLLTISCDSKKQNKQQTLSFAYTQKDTLKISIDDKAILSIKNPHAEKMNIQFRYNDKFWFTKNDIINDIKKIVPDNTLEISSTAFNSWLFSMENTYASKNEDLPKMAFQSPSIFLNSNGAGICSD